MATKDTLLVGFIGLGMMGGKIAANLEERAGQEPLAGAAEVLLTEWLLQPRDDGGTDLHLVESGFRGQDLRRQHQWLGRRGPSPPCEGRRRLNWRGVLRRRQVEQRDEPRRPALVRGVERELLDGEAPSAGAVGPMQLHRQHLNVDAAPTHSGARVRAQVVDPGGVERIAAP